MKKAVGNQLFPTAFYLMRMYWSMFSRQTGRSA